MSDAAAARTVTEHIRAHLRAVLTGGPTMPPLEVMCETEWSLRFEELRARGLIMGAMRYGRLKAKGKSQYDRVKGMRDALDRYEASGNTECLVDAANLAMLEFEEGEHPLKHFRATDDTDHITASR